MQIIVFARVFHFERNYFSLFPLKKWSFAKVANIYNKEQL